MGYLCVLGVDLEAEVVSFHVFAGDGSGAAADEGVQDEVFLVGVLLEQVPNRCRVGRNRCQVRK